MDILLNLKMLARYTQEEWDKSIFMYDIVKWASYFRSFVLYNKFLVLTVLLIYAIIAYGILPSVILNVNM